VTRQPEELKNVGYEIFIAVLCAISISNVFIFYLTPDRDIAGVLRLMDWTYSFIFLVDFIIRFSLAKSRSTYFFKQFGWADLLSVAPSNLAKLVRVFRIIRTMRMLSSYGAHNIKRDLKENVSAVAFLTVLLLIMLILEFGSIAIIKVESMAPSAQIITAQDAIWFIWQTVTTTGYGDIVPVTGEGRFVGIVVMSAGTALFGTLTGFLANAFFSGRRRKQVDKGAGKGEGDHKATLSEMRRLMQEQRQSQAELEAKIEELESLLKEP
jgi:voltage-gated potassium channel